jgi:uncharacterized membrane protein
MKKISKKISIILISVFAVIQFIPSSRNINKELLSTDFTSIYEVPKNIKQTLQNACYDCHSNNTNYPWYNRVQPIAWFLENHIEEAKKELNFSEYGSYTTQKQNRKLEEISEAVKEKKMPLKAYQLMHSKAKLTEKERKEFTTWFTSILK